MATMMKAILGAVMLAAVGCGGEMPIEGESAPVLDRGWQISIVGLDSSCAGTMTTKTGPGVGQTNFMGFAQCDGTPSFSKAALSGYVKADRTLFLTIAVGDGFVNVWGSVDAAGRVEDASAAVLGQVARFSAH